MYLIFDTETTGLPRNYNAPISDSENWPRAVQIAWQLHDHKGQLLEHKDFLITPDGFTIPYDAERIHGISTELATKRGVSIHHVFEEFEKALAKTQYIVGQNIGFDIHIMGAEFYRYGVSSVLSKLPVLDTCTELTAELCRIPGGRAGKFKYPNLTELHEFLFGTPFAEAHNATADVEATARCFFELLRRGEGFSPSQVSEQAIRLIQEKYLSPIPLWGLHHINLKVASEKLKSKEDISLSATELTENLTLLQSAPFAHLHNHSQHSVLQSTASIADLVTAAAKENMPAVALTDHGNMMGAFHFTKEVAKHNKEAKAKNAKLEEEGKPATHTLIKPIIGCEFYICENHLDKTKKDNGYQVVLLAKNKDGYQNLIKMASIAYTEGFYYVPRIDKGIVEQYKDQLIVLSGNLQGEIPSKILNLGNRQAEEALLWWKEHFQEDFYIELMRHGQENENRANAVLIELAKKHGVKLVATNNTYYISPQDANAHDILLCVKDGEKQATTIGQGRGFRNGLPNEEYYFKSSQQMKELFKDIPEAILSIKEIIDKITPYELARNILLPKFSIPKEFQMEGDPTGKKGENKYLRHLTYLGAKKRYKELTNEVRERLDFELSIIEKTGYPGYFLIVEDFITAARNMGVSVGPGRGSAAGSAVAYCLGITNIDPIKYDLLFERFLNPDRVSMPDIDIDFEDDGRGRVLDYVIGKYGANQVAQIATYGTMAAKSSIRDTARVLDLPLKEADQIAKLIPNISLKKIFSLTDEELKEKVGSDLPKIDKLKKIAEGHDLSAKTVQQACILEGSVRNTGIHACGVIITPDDITNFVPVMLAKDSDLFVTQFDNSVVESAGLLKMDFLGLKTLTILKDAVSLIQKRHGFELDIDHIPLDDKPTYALFQRGETIGIFQYESPGMQKYMRELKPTVFADLIAMNALYRPGPMDYIPSFIHRKQGIEPITYDLADMEEYLKDTYGITVYQEQVMLLSQKLAGFTKGEADKLRKAMGKKLKDVLAEMKPKFIEGGGKKGHPAEVLEKIWKDWEAFASYAFNKSHSTCYAWIAYQTAYLKANYPAEFMAAVLSNNMNDIKSISFFLSECHRMGIKVLSPDVNESEYKFTVNKEGAIRFGMGAVKGLGKAAVDTIVETRKSGAYQSIFDMVKRIDLKSANKKAFESLALAGGFDSFPEVHRAQFFHQEPSENMVFLEKILRYGAKAQESAKSIQLSLFGDSPETQIPEPKMPYTEEWSPMEKLRREKEVVGIYISGHPLDIFKYQLQYLCNKEVIELSGGLEGLENQVVRFGGIITKTEHKTSKTGKGWGIFTIEDYSGVAEFRIFGEEYLKFRHFLSENQFVFIKAYISTGYINKEGQQSAPKINFTYIDFLENALSNIHKLQIATDVQQVNKENLDFFKSFLKEFKGNTPISFLIIGRNGEKEIELPLNSYYSKVTISKELFDRLSATTMLYRINDETRWLNKIREEEEITPLEEEFIMEENFESEE
ncbi:DNA polymerase III subunit alpha [Capnocytophaga sp. oral taxon 338]|uniref:DNA polymerase III subunit alpha n=1 Tax=Capnocytophaga sp. oral taxon 338 TaxID=710239 RepID=UPI000202C013|nr:DNA polymerase III subunit alpha [Capnocytophaga sp. oral taxon 338]EGD33982.1 DNA-directed DNA polymerase III alpha subunit [Capnocytophaga sp. oral taxon 338 str. F0234]